MRNPYYLGDQVAETEISGWVDAWSSSPSAYAVEAETARDVAEAVLFAARNKLRLVVKGGGHSYQGTSNAADSLLVWTRKMNRIALHEDCVTVQSGAVWMDVYNAVTTNAGRYVQGGGCATVGVAGLIQSGGFGSFSRTYGLAASGLLEAKVVTADGRIRTVNHRNDRELFWALKGGGGGTFGVVTEVTLATHSLPPTFGDVSVTLRATNDAAYARLIDAFLKFYAAKLFGDTWGESVRFHRGRRLEASMVFAGLSKQEAESPWREFLAAFASDPDVIVERPFFVEALPATRWWDAGYLQRYSPGSVFVDDRPGQPKWHAWWQGDEPDVGVFLHGYASLWLPAHLLRERYRARLATALQRGSSNWTIALHFNKGLAGARGEVRDRARATAMNPAAVDAFALAIVAGGARPAYRDGGPVDPDAQNARRDAAAIRAAIAPLQALVTRRGSYVAESDYFQPDWREAYWGEHYATLLRIKRAYDPTGLFFVHHGVGSEYWSDDGFVRTGTL